MVVLSNSRKLKPAFSRALNETDAGPGEGASFPSAAPLTRKRQGFPWRTYWMAIWTSDPDRPPQDEAGHVLFRCERAVADRKAAPDVHPAGRGIYGSLVLVPDERRRKVAGRRPAPAGQGPQNGGRGQEDGRGSLHASDYIGRGGARQADEPPPFLFPRPIGYNILQGPGDRSPVPGRGRRSEQETRSNTWTFVKRLYPSPCASSASPAGKASGGGSCPWASIPATSSSWIRRPS